MWVRFYMLQRTKGSPYNSWAKDCRNSLKGIAPKSKKGKKYGRGKEI